MDLHHSITLVLLPAAVRLSTHALWCGQGAFSSLASHRFGREVVMTLLARSATVSREALRRLDCASVADFTSQGAKDVFLALRVHCLDTLVSEL